MPFPIHAIPRREDSLPLENALSYNSTHQKVRP